MNVQFDEQQVTRSSRPETSRHGLVTKIVIKLGLAKDERGANIVMLALSAVFILLTIGVLFYR